MVELDQITLLVSTEFNYNSSNSNSNSNSLFVKGFPPLGFHSACGSAALLVLGISLRWQDRRMQFEPFKDVTSYQIYPGIFSNDCRPQVSTHGARPSEIISWREIRVVLRQKEPREIISPSPISLLVKRSPHCNNKNRL